MMPVMCIVMWLNPRSSRSEPLDQLQDHDVSVEDITAFSKIADCSLSPDHSAGLLISLSSM